MWREIERGKFGKRSIIKQKMYDILNSKAFELQVRA